MSRANNTIINSASDILKLQSDFKMYFDQSANVCLVFESFVPIEFDALNGKICFKNKHERAESDWKMFVLFIENVKYQKK